MYNFCMQNLHLNIVCTYTLMPRMDRSRYESTARGWQTIASNDSHFYLVYGGSYENYWVDIASGMNSSLAVTHTHTHTHTPRPLTPHPSLRLSLPPSLPLQA